MPRACEGLGFETYTETLFGEAFLPFRYWCISLAQLSAEEYLATGNPVAYGLAPLMDHGNLSKSRLKAICLSGIARSEITEVQAAILACFVDTYLPLTQAEESEFQQLIQREEVTVMQFITSWERRARFEKTRENLLALLGEKFGSYTRFIIFLMKMQDFFDSYVIAADYQTTLILSISNQSSVFLPPFLKCP